ncbi:glutathione S-transferase family protein [Leptospira sanjuanensis]|uniref:glutathione S-transferase family protein n=1 Tax=Leptospira sanjuanensis TaxID=2879643 RepID=UPI001EE82672|nr:glutathione S-transferase [Leptospira sanjuanensis]MCG6168105.1 glutathione S-transferase [Leptospira sanjuanensis]
MIELFESAISGNSHKVRMLLSFLNLKYESVSIDLKGKEQKSEGFLKKNPFGQVPVLKDKEVIVRDSHAILVYLALEYGKKEDWFPGSSFEAAKVIQWISTSANEVGRGPAALRAHHKFGRKIDENEALSVTNDLLRILENQLEQDPWLIGDKITIADIALYPYIALAHEGKIDLKPYEKIRAWLKRIESLPGYVSMEGIELQGV